MYKSKVKELNKVDFPEFIGERVYMQKFFKDEGLPSHLERWQKTVDQMLLNIDTKDNPIFIMIDQGIIQPNTSHRRPGPHIDGYWVEELKAHGGSGGHRMHLNNKWQVPNPWNHVNLTVPESIVLASDIMGCKGYLGDWDGVLGEGGDCSTIDLSGLAEMHLKADTAYQGNIGFIHESIPLPEQTQRTLVRLSIKNC